MSISIVFARALLAELQNRGRYHTDYDRGEDKPFSARMNSTAAIR